MKNSSHENFNIYVSILFLISVSLSIIASFFTTFLYYKFRPLNRSYPARLICLISLTDGLIWADRLINIISKIVNDDSFEDQNHNYCIFSSIFRCFLTLFNLCCVFLIAFSLLYEMALYKNARSIEAKGYIISTIFSVIMAFIPFMMDQYDVLDPYQCWIVNNYTNLAVFYAPLITVFLFDLFCVIYLIKTLKRIKGDFASWNLMIKFLMFPTILLIAWLPGLIRIAGGFEGVIIDGFMYIFMPMQGILNPFIYGSIFSIVKNQICSKKADLKTPFKNQSTQTQFSEENFIINNKFENYDTHLNLS